MRVGRGEVIGRTVEMPGQGWWVVFKDLEGTTLAIFQSAPQQEE